MMKFQSWRYGSERAAPSSSTHESFQLRKIPMSLSMLPETSGDSMTISSDFVYKTIIPAAGLFEDFVRITDES